jgi:uncharacterized protein (DUF488 family)
VTALSKLIFTLGHSTRSLEEFIDILHAQKVKALADVRKFPHSRKFPHFNTESLAQTLPEAGVLYRSFTDLGGRRKPAKDSPNTGWRNDSFRGYADYLQTGEFETALDHLMQFAERQPTAIMCAEAVPWRCHRSLIADALLVRGWQVIDIFDANTAKPHLLTKFAQVSGTRITYPQTEPSLF